MTATARRNGFVIALTLMVMLLLELLAAGMLLVALQERAVASTRVMLAGAAARAESAVARQVGVWTDSDFQRMRIGETRVLDFDSVAVTIERLRGDLFRLTGIATLRPGSAGSRRAELLIRAFDPFLLLRQLTGALVTGGRTELIGNTIVDASSSTPCTQAGPAAAIATPFPELVTTGRSVELAGNPDLMLDTFPREPPNRIGGLDYVELSSLVEPRPGGIITPAPVEVNNRCDESAPANWGAPSIREAMRGLLSLHPGRMAISKIAGGAGQGLLVVTGSLFAHSGAVFNGVVIVGGGLILRGVTVNGAVYTRSADATALLIDSTVRFDPCAIENALFGVRPLRTPLFPPGRMWLPVH